MSGPIHSWVFRTSLVHGGRILLGLAVLALAVTAFSPRDIATAAADPGPAGTGPELASDAADWPRTALRLWFLVPQLLPRHDH